MRLVAPVTAAFATTEDAPAFTTATLSNARLAAIVAAWDAARNDERAEHAAFRERGAKRSEAFVLEDLLAPELRDALRDGSPAALAPLLGGQGRVRTLQGPTRDDAEAVRRPSTARAGRRNRGRRTTEHATRRCGCGGPEQLTGPPRSSSTRPGLVILFAFWRKTRSRRCARHLFPAFPPFDMAIILGPQAVCDPHPTTNATASRHNDVCEVA